MAEDLKIILESKLNEAKKTKETLEQQGAFKTDPKKLQQLNIAIQQLESLLKTLNTSSAQQLNSARASFNKIFETIIKVGLEAGKASEKMQGLYKSLQQVNEKLGTRQTARAAIASRLDKQGRLSADDSGARKIVIDSDIKYAKGQVAKNPETLRNNLAAISNDQWQGIFASEKDYKRAQKAVGQLELEERQVQEQLRNLDKEIEDLTKNLHSINEQIEAEAGKTTLSPEVQTAAGAQADVQGAIAHQQDLITQEKVAENSERNAASVAEFNTQINKQSTSLGRAFKQFSIYAVALRTVKKAMSDATKTIKDLDKYLTEQAMVTGKTRKETYGLLESYQAMASEIGATTKEIAAVSTQFMRQGKTTADALTLTRAAVQAAKVAGISGTESVNYLTTALNGFQLSAQEAMKVSDKFASIAATSATSYEEIATALSKVASQANIAGMSIDYTTALLAKGIETTREPAESIGTALKTIIARMRELTDYGKTLEDGMNINNVETQLQYVGIALRNANGELRSTEDVLDELGNKWDTLSSNQQAAVAKALAGTRQQSRLIAMMNDYERVTELQEIAQRSAGATAAQAAVYMQGMEAALNKVNVAWEKIVTSITNSDIIINAINSVATVMNTLGDFLNTTAGMLTTITSIAAIGVIIIGQKMTEYAISKQQQAINIQQQKSALEQSKLDALAIKTQQKQSTLSLRELANQKKIEASKAMQELLDLKAAHAQGKRLEESEETYKRIADQAAIEAEKAELEASSAERADAILNTYQAQSNLLDSQISLIGKLKTGFSGLLTPLYLVIGAWKAITGAINAARIASKKKHQQEVKQDGAEVPLKTSKAAAEIIGQLGVYGIPIAAAVMLALAGIALGITAAVNSAQNKAANAANNVNKLSNEIYKLQEKANAIKTMEKQYDALDKKIIKTTADQEKMNELLDSTADKLSEDEKKTYENLQSTEAKSLFLEKAKNDAITEANKKRREQIDILEKLDDTQREKLLTDKTNADYLQAVDAIYAVNNNTLYTYIDSLTSVNDGVEKLTQNILENLSAEQAWDYAQGKSAGAIQKLVDVINDATVTIGEEQVALSEVLDSSKYSLEDKIKAYDDLYTTIQSIGDQTLLSSFEKAYGQWAQLQESMSTTAIQFMDSIGVTIDKLNDFGLALNKLGLTTEEASSRISQLFDLIAGGASVSDSITRLFSDVLSQFAPDSDDYKALYNRILNAYQAAAGTGMLNMGQNLTSLRSQINALYEKASKWNQLSLQEQTEFIQDNYDLFKGAGGQELFQAFQTGNYNAIKNALATNEVIKEQIRLRLQQLQIDLSIAEAAEQRNEAEIKWIKDQIEQLEDYQDAAAEIYQADLELRLEQENKQLSLYKTYLEKQKEALEDSLDKRKEAYQKYFDAVNQEQEDQEYYDQAEMLSNNLSKLSSSTDASSRQQAKELEQQLQELEKERLQTLRERAQEAVLNNLDTEVSQINEKFDKLLENQAALLAAMQGDISADPNSFINKVLSAGIMNMTTTQAEDFIKNDFVPAYNSSISPDTLENIKVRQEGTSLYLTLNNQEVEITQSAQQDLSAAILKALRELGISI